VPVGERVVLFWPPAREERCGPLAWKPGSVLGGSAARKVLVPAVVGPEEARCIASAGMDRRSRFAGLNLTGPVLSCREGGCAGGSFKPFLLPSLSDRDCS